MRLLGRVAVFAAAFSLAAPLDHGFGLRAPSAYAADSAAASKSAGSSKSDKSRSGKTASGQAASKSSKSAKSSKKGASAKSSGKTAKSAKKSRKSKKSASSAARAAGLTAAATLAMTEETAGDPTIVAPGIGETPVDPAPGVTDPAAENPETVAPGEAGSPTEIVDGPTSPVGEVPTEVDGPVPDPGGETPTEVDGPVPDEGDGTTTEAETPSPGPAEETPTEVDGPVPDEGDGTTTEAETPSPGPVDENPTEVAGPGGGSPSQPAPVGGEGSGGSSGGRPTPVAPGSSSGGGTQTAGGGAPSVPVAVDSPAPSVGEGSSGGPTVSVSNGAQGGAGKPSLRDVIQSVFGGSRNQASDNDDQKAAAAGGGAATGGAVATRGTGGAATEEIAVVEEAIAVETPVATAVETPVEEVATSGAKAKAAVEPEIAKAAPRIELSSGGDSRQKYRQYEITALGLTRESRQVANALGFRILSERKSPLLGNRVVARLRTPSGQTAPAALQRIRGVLPEVTFDYSHLYRPSGEGAASVRYAAAMIGAPADQPGVCAASSRVGLIDSGVGNHETLSAARITRKNFVAKNAATNVAHGTAIASILVGDLPGSGPLLSGAQLYSANVFAQDGAGLRADPAAIIEALDWMAQSRVPVVNLSLMGPENDLLTQAIKAATQRGLVLVAAAGNDGPGGAPAYPAAYPEVIAVSAVDARGRPYARNNRGSYIYVAAPGVDVWGADARGGLAFWTGTSFAAPFVTASIARDLAQGRVTNINDGRKRIASTARDLGAPGRDPIYGYGLLQLANCAAGGAPAVISSKGR